MTELARGEYEVAADGSFTMSLKFSGDPHHCTPEDLRRSSFPTTESYAKFLDGLGYKRRDTIGPFGSGSVLTTSGDKIVGREEPIRHDRDDVFEDYSGPDAYSAPEPIRPALTWRTETPFDPFAGYEVKWSIYHQDQPNCFASPDLQATSPFSGSAYLLPKTA